MLCSLLGQLLLMSVYIPVFLPPPKGRGNAMQAGRKVDERLFFLAFPLRHLFVASPHLTPPFSRRLEVFKKQTLGCEPKSITSQSPPHLPRTQWCMLHSSRNCLQVCTWKTGSVALTTPARTGDAFPLAICSQERPAFGEGEGRPVPVPRTVV